MRCERKWWVEGIKVVAVGVVYEVSSFPIRVCRGGVCIIYFVVSYRLGCSVVHTIPTLVE